MTRFDPPIEGQTPIDDISGLRDKSVQTTAQLNAAEAENIRKAVVKYLAARPTRRWARFDAPWMFKLHREMFGDVWTWAGEPRRRELNIGSPPHQVEVDLHNLADDLRAWEQHNMPLAEQAVRLHHRAVQIHPFQNGNGRWARMVANVWLKLHGVEPVVWPEPELGVVSPVRAQYLEAVKAADAGDYSKLSAMHVRFAGKP